MEEKLKEISNKLNFQKQLCFDALKEFSENHPAELMPFEKEKIEKLLDRMFIAEKDYLYDNPQDYVGLYGDE